MKKVLILFGGNSTEHDVSCKSAYSVLKAIDHKKFRITCVKITHDSRWFLMPIFPKDDKFTIDENKEILNIISFLRLFDVVFPVMHGKNGEDGRLQGMLELFQIPFVGCKTLSSSIAMDKEMTKIILNKAGIPQIPYITVKNNLKIKQIENEFNYPVIIKPCNGGSSIGISKADNRKQLKKALQKAFQYDKKLIIEPFIKMQELECAILENKKLIASTVGEILPANTFYDYDAKYENENSKTLIPAHITTDIQKRIQKLAKKAFLSIEGNGLSRIDFFYDKKDDKIYLNEINTIPGFTNISMYAKLLEYDGISYQKLITTLIDSAN